MKSSPRRLGGEFVAALADRDAPRLEACLSTGVRLRALVPSGVVEHQGLAAVVRRIMSWFEDPDRIEVVEKNERPVAGRLHLSYKLREYYSDGAPTVIHQDAVCDTQDGRFTGIDLLCSGHLPDPASSVPGDRRFDAGDLGCGSGLPVEFRREIDATPIGSTLEVSTRDPSAREDLPSLARLLGHRVVSVRRLDDGSTVVTVQRGR